MRDQASFNKSTKAFPNTFLFIHMFSASSYPQKLLSISIIICLLMVKFNPSPDPKSPVPMGGMFTDCMTPDGYYVDKDGVWIS